MLHGLPSKHGSYVRLGSFEGRFDRACSGLGCTLGRHGSHWLSVVVQRCNQSFTAWCHWMLFCGFSTQ